MFAGLVGEENWKFAPPLAAYSRRTLFKTTNLFQCFFQESTCSLPWTFLWTAKHTKWPFIQICVVWCVIDRDTFILFHFKEKDFGRARFLLVLQQLPQNTKKLRNKSKTTDQKCYFFVFARVKEGKEARRCLIQWLGMVCWSPGVDPIKYSGPNSAWKLRPSFVIKESAIRRVNTPGRGRSGMPPSLVKHCRVSFKRQSFYLAMVN